MPYSCNLNSFEDTDKLAEEIKAQIKLPQFIGLIGPMGAGKTYFVKALAKALSLKNCSAVNSPSFALHQRYEGDDFSLEHLDLFRLGNSQQELEDELESIGFWDLFADEKVLIVAEWADLLDKKMIPKKFNPIYLQFELDGQQRRVTRFNTTSA